MRIASKFTTKALKFNKEIINIHTYTIKVVFLKPIVVNAY